LNPNLKAFSQIIHSLKDEICKEETAENVQVFTLPRDGAERVNSTDKLFSGASRFLTLQLNGPRFSLLAEASTDRNIENRISALHKECNEVPAGGAASDF
jgi:hypothetical protein